MRTADHYLPQGYCSEAVNCRFIRGAIEPRGGMLPMQWSVRYGEAFPVSWPVKWSTPAPLGEPLATGKFEDPNGIEWEIQVCADPDSGVDRARVFALAANNRAYEVPLPVPLGRAGRYWITQCFNVLMLFRDVDEAPLVLTDVANGFQTISQYDNPTDTGEGTQTIPNGRNAVFYRNRLFITNRESTGGRVDSVVASDYGNYSKYLPLTGDFRVNQGDSDELVRLYEFSQEAIIAFKDSSVYYWSIPGGNLDLATLSNITTEFGLVSPRSVITVGNEVWFLSQFGVMRLFQTEDNKMQAAPMPVSEKIQPLMDRINWLDASTVATAAYSDNRSYWAVPIDDKSQNNCVAVFDHINGEWAGYDYWDGAAKVAQWFTMDYANKRRLFCSDYTGQIFLYDHGSKDYELTTPSSYQASAALACRPADGATITVNGQEAIVGDRDIETNNGKVWAIGYSSSLTEVAAPNLATGFSDGSWLHGTDEVQATQLGVAFRDGSPITIEADDSEDCIKVFADASQTLEPKDIPAYAITRAYHYSNADSRRAVRYQAHVETLNALCKVTVIQDGVNEEQVLINETGTEPRSPLEYTTFGTEDYVPSNANNDFEAKYRKDYSWQLGAGADSPYAFVFHTANNIRLERYQSWRRAFFVARRGTSFKVKLEVVRGRARWHAVNLTARAGRRTFETHAG
tara:strand:+ start:13144 stop:15195 length:2052 start_codon:yes stop_codon:yes gene_type:complete